MSKKSRNNNFWFLKSLAYFCMVVGGIALGATIYLLYVHEEINYLTKIDLDKASKIGDFVGGFVAIFWTIAGVVLLYITLRVQTEEFKNTQKAIAKQQFETTYFNMLSILLQIKSNLKGRINYKDLKNDRQVSSKFSAQRFLNAAHEQLVNLYLKRVKDDSAASESIEKIERKIEKNIAINEVEKRMMKDYVDEIYIDFYNKHHTELGHYFRYIYNLMKFAVENRIEFGDEDQYINLIQAQLTNDELGLIYYNAISRNALNERKEPKFYNWLEEYNFFENIDHRGLIRREHHVLYPKTKFKFLNRDELKRKMHGTLAQRQ